MPGSPHRVRTALVRWIGPALGVLCLLAAVTAADPPSVPEPARFDELPPVHPVMPSAATGKPATQLLVLKAGRIVEGQITEVAGGYRVVIPNGSMLVPFEHVKFQAEDLQDAYRKYRQTMPIPTASNHIALARWCLSQKLHDAARTELRAALALEPGRDEARKMLLRLETLLDAPAVRRTAGRSPVVPQRPTADAFTPPEAQSLAGLPREAAQDFVARIQPLLMNSCGSARCHGDSGSSRFRLVFTRGGYRSHRILAERNLAAVMEMIDAGNPQESPLLVKPRGNHGVGGRAIFHGPSGQKQYRSLEEWVIAVTSTSPGKRQKPFSLVSGRDTPSSPQNTTTIEPERVAEQFPIARSIRPDNPSAVAGAAETRPGVKPPRLLSVDDADPLVEALRHESKDAFDPNEFNLKVHGAPVRGEP